MRAWLDRISRKAVPWPLLATAALLAAFSCTPTAETLLSPLDRVYWHLVTNATHHGERDKVAVILVDRKTVQAMGGGVSYSRTSYAQVLDRLGGAASVVLDMSMLTSAPGDAALADAITRHGRVVLPAVVSQETRRADTAMLPSLPLRRAAAAIGQRSVALGTDHLVVGILPYIGVGGTGDTIPHVALQAIRVAGASLPGGDAQRRALDRLLQRNATGSGALALFLPPRFDLDRYSYVDVAQGRIPESAWRGRIVYIGDGMSDLSGQFELSSSPSGRVRRVEVDALATEALLDGRMLLPQPLAVRMAFNFAVTIGTLLICLLVSGWRMYALAFAWLGAFVACELALLVYVAYWAPIAPPLAACALVFALCGWRRARSLREFLMKEYGVLHGMVGRHAFVGLKQASGAADPGPMEGDVATAMQRIREWQTAYVDMIETLPYPIFVEQNGKLLMCNERGKQALAEADVDAGTMARQVMAAAYDEILTAKATGKIRSAEVTLNGRTQMMMVTPFGDGDAHSSTASMICLVDIHNIKAAVESDRMTLRHMAHDLRNPLSTVLALLEARNRDAASTDEDFLADLHKLVDYSLRVAQDFTQLSRAEHLDTQAYVPVSANDLATEAVDQVWHSAGAKRICVEGPHYDGEDVFVLGNRDMLLRALTNLLDNAIKYSPEGTVVDVWVRADDRRVSVAVQDQGIGIPADAMPRLFEPFFQIDGTYRDASRGVGLGLPFVKAVVERHAGSVDVTSTPGRGSCFTVNLPRTVAATLDDA